MSVTEPRVGRHNGILLLEADIALPLTGTLFFGVGSRDESPRSVGLAHLVEHLVMRGVGRVAIPHNATTAPDNLSFYATGTPDLVADFLSRVSTSIAALGQTTPEALQAEIDTVATELGDGYEDTELGPLQLLYGLTGPGLIGMGHPALSSFTLDDVRAFAKRWLHTGNAAIAFTGPIPAGLAVNLPEGIAPVRGATPSPQHPLPGWTPSPAGPLSLSVELTGSTTVMIALRAMVEIALMDALRRDSSLVYGVEPALLRIEGDRHELTIWINPPEDNLEKTVVLAVQTIRALARDGFDDELFRHTLDMARNEATLPNSHGMWLDDYAVELLRGETPTSFNEMATGVDTLDAEQIRATLAAGMPSLLVTVGRQELDGDTLKKLDLPFITSHTLVGEGKSSRELFKELMRPGIEILSPRFGRGMRGTQLVIEPRRLGFLFPDGSISLPLDEIVLAGRSPDGKWDLTLQNGNGAIIDPKDWRGGDKHVGAFMAKLDPAVVYERRT
ncbi:insulinase family protein [Glaciihabitans arcticus]|uniref:Insulinase family protein n=1 Tax=Glaciihabitans arcticus TaxID=2668039 RepID=A0A4Q9GRL8_9MICO|nr:insulinase family protein [Glaciihabitans arcticus]TBN56734.1 insulinase family protein [Glaciihabitans arcticus]